MVKPIYHEGELVAYAAIIAHFAEIGGMVVGSFAANATEVFQEGLRLPPVRLMRGGVRVREVWDIMLANHRTPRHTWGDLHAMLGALKVADDTFPTLCAKYGAPFLRSGRRRCSTTPSAGCARRSAPFPTASTNSRTAWRMTASAAGRSDAGEGQQSPATRSSPTFTGSDRPGARSDQRHSRGHHVGDL